MTYRIIGVIDGVPVRLLADVIPPTLDFNRLLAWALPLGYIHPDDEAMVTAKLEG